MIRCPTALTAQAIVEYFAGELGSEDENAFEQHLYSCDEAPTQLRDGQAPRIQPAALRKRPARQCHRTFGKSRLSNLEIPFSSVALER
jgi:hypothetical protein